MDQQAFHRQLIHRYVTNQATEQELEAFFALLESEAMDEELLSYLKEASEKAEGGQLNPEVPVTASPEIQESTKPLYKRIWLAAAVLLVAISVTWLTVLRNDKVQPAKANAVAMAGTSPATRFITLADGSRIVLHGGSQLIINPNFNTANKREVTLIGEAYFDIRHNAKRPFIIHTGNFSTTVLGTAFNIKAYAGQKTITVTVTRGRVKVERGTQLLAILTPNKQLIANSDGTKPAIPPQKVIADEALNWAGADMKFDAMPFNELAEKLGKRFGVQINFKNPALTGCPITGHFKGTESLHEVLEILSQTSGTTYVIKDHAVYIDGKGCQ